MTRAELKLLREARDLVEAGREHPTALTPQQRQKLRTVRDLLHEIRQRWNRTPAEETDDELDDLIVRLTAIRDALP